MVGINLIAYGEISDFLPTALQWVRIGQRSDDHFSGQKQNLITFIPELIFSDYFT